MDRSWIAASLLACALLAGCLHARDFRAPAERLTDHTPWTEQRDATRLDAGAGGMSASDLGVRLGAVQGLPGRTQLGVNVAHLAGGLLGVHGKWNALDRSWLALSLGGGVQWASPRWMWYLDRVDPSLRETLRDVHLVAVPVRLNAAVPLGIVDAGVGLGYLHASVFGRIDDDVLLFDGALGARRWFVEPVVRLYLAERLALEVRGHVPLRTMFLAAAEAEYDTGEGVVVGVRSATWEPLALPRTLGLRIAVEGRLGATHLRLGAATGPLPRSLGLVATPYLLVYWRL